MNAGPDPGAAMHELVFPQLERRIEAHAGETLFQSARRHGVRIVGACGGRGTCGSCLVRIIEGKVHAGNGEPVRSGADADQPLALAGESGKSDPREPAAGKWIRACCTSALSDCTVEVAPRSLASVVRTGVETGLDEDLPVNDPVVLAHEVHLEPPTLRDNVCDAERIARALGEPALRLDLAAARELPGALRHGGWALLAHVRGAELIGTAPLASPTLGLAIDLGTTNVAGFLVDLASGRTLAALGIENPQVGWGADLVSRLNGAARSAALSGELRAAALRAIQALAHDLCREVGARTSDIVEAAVCANTAMHHLLLGLPVAQLGRAPFVAALREGLEVKARELDLVICPGAWVHAGPNIGGFVGSDHVSALLATEARWGAGGTSLVMDIGTNTEISLIHDGAIRSTSCPSGPALEGGNVSCGMRAAEGAIERVYARNGRLEVQVIGGKQAVGVCGSGVLDALAAMRTVGMLDERGRLSAKHPDVCEQGGQRSAQLAPGVRFSQDDVRAVQLAKAAIRAGTELLLAQAGVEEGEIGRFVIAGAFGAYIDVDSAIAIGLLPALGRERFEQVGNAAGVGVRRLLASRAARAHAAALARRCRYVELSTLEGFQKAFMKHIGFGPIHP